MMKRMKFVRGTTIETERRSREIQLLLNIIEPDPVYQASIFSDEARALDVSPSSAQVVQERLESLLGCSLPGMLSMPLWRLVDAIRQLDPEWPESRHS